MKGLIAYHTKYGNGRIIAEAIARGLRESGNEIATVSIPVKDVGSDYDFVVVSSPTRFGNMAKTVRKFIRKSMGIDAWRGKPFIAVGTGLRAEEGGGEPGPSAPARSEDTCAPGESADQVYEALEEAGLKPASEPQRFWVSGMKGPLAEGEEERALEFGRRMGRELARSSLQVPLHDERL